MSLDLLYPEKIIFGSNSIKELPDLLPDGCAVMLVSGKSAVNSGQVKKIENLLCDFKLIDASGLAVPEPPLESVDKIIELGRSEHAEAVIGLGGGSVIDTAKAAAAIIPKEGNVAEYFYGKREIKSKGLVFAALPTTAGTGAEVTKNSVLTDSVSKIKKSIRSPFMVPDIAIVDPVLTLDMPPSITASSGMDAMVQAIESYTSDNANDVTKPLAKSAVVQIFANIANAYINGKDLTAREAMAEGSLMSAMAFSQSGLGAVHGLAHPIGSLLDVPHGVACSILLQPVMEFNSPVAAPEYAELARICLPSVNPSDFDETLSEEFIEAIGSLCAEIDIPEDFSEYGLKEDHFDFILENCRSNSMKTNPRPMSDEDVINLLRGLL